MANPHVLHFTAHDAIPRAAQIALQLAIGVQYGKLAEMPAGLHLMWNEAAQDGAFDDCKTYGEMASAFLRHRLERLNP